MNDEEVEQLNRYHRKVWDNLSPLLEKYGDSEALKWLENECKPIVRS